MTKTKILLTKIYQERELVVGLKDVTFLSQVRKVEALSDFTGEQDGDLSFKKGEILTVIKTRYFITARAVITVVSYGNELFFFSANYTAFAILTDVFSFP